MHSKVPYDRVGSLAEGRDPTWNIEVYSQARVGTARAEWGIREVAYRSMDIVFWDRHDWMEILGIVAISKLSVYTRGGLTVIHLGITLSKTRERDLRTSTCMSYQSKYSNKKMTKTNDKSRLFLLFPEVRFPGDIRLPRLEGPGDGHRLILSMS